MENSKAYAPQLRARDVCRDMFMYMPHVCCPSYPSIEKKATLANIKKHVDGAWHQVPGVPGLLAGGSLVVGLSNIWKACASAMRKHRIIGITISKKPYGNNPDGLMKTSHQAEVRSCWDSSPYQSSFRWRRCLPSICKTHEGAPAMPDMVKHFAYPRNTRERGWINSGQMILILQYQTTHSYFGDGSPNKTICIDYWPSICGDLLVRSLQSPHPSRMDNHLMNFAHKTPKGSWKKENRRITETATWGRGFPIAISACTPLATMCHEGNSHGPQGSLISKDGILLASLPILS